jgi:hypothetical protein
MRGATRVMLCVMSVAAALSCKGQAAAEIIDGKKLFADCQDGDNPNARDSTYKWGNLFWIYFGCGRCVGSRRIILCARRSDGGASARRCQALHPRTSGQAIHVGTSIDC